MLITTATEDNVEKVYVNRFGSVVCYFTAARRGVELNVEPGMYTYPAAFAQDGPAMGACVMALVAARLGISEDEVLRQPFSALKRIADPPLPNRYRYASRSPNRRR